jgi:ubiquinone/menaquinone biosynthesis C-methylase UbiE
MGMPRVTDYDAISFQYDCRYRVRDYRGIERALLQFVGPADSVKLLEVGCGTGHCLGFLERCGRSPVGIDSSKQMLLRAREVSSEWALLQARAEVLPFQNSYFDRVFCINSYHHFTNKPTFLSEARRILRPSGGLMVIGLNPHGGQDKWWVYDYFPETVKLDKERYQSTAGIKAHMEQYGFIRCEFRVVQHIRATMPARVAVQQGFLERGYTSQLAILSEQEYEAGKTRLKEATEDAAVLGEDLLLTTDLRFFGVVGWI